MPKPERIYQLDVLRFVAAFAVVIYHYGFRGFAADGLSPLGFPELAPVAKYGYLGVNLFFLISGFVILMTASGGSARRFVISRAVRLYPAYWVCCTLSFLVMLAVEGGREAVSPGSYLVNLTMFHGFLRVRSVDTVYWTLLVEMRFYFLVFAVLLLGQMRRVDGLLGVWLVLSLAAAYWPNKYVSFVVMPNHAPYFIAGAMFYLIRVEGPSIYKMAVILASFAAAVQRSLEKIVALTEHYDTSFSGLAVGAVLAVMFGAFLLLALRKLPAMTNPRWLALGALTYPLYLLHQNIGYAIFHLGHGSINRHVLMWGTVALMLALAYLVNKRVEQPSAGPLRGLLERASQPRVQPAV